MSESSASARYNGRTAPLSAPPARNNAMSPARTRLAARAAALGAATLCGALYAQSVNLKPGLYEVVSSSQVQVSPELQARLPPGYLERLQQPHTQQLCLSDADLDKVSRKLAEERANADPSCKLGEHS